MPKTLLRMILNATLPRLIQRALLVALPPELGQYLLACKQGIHIAGAAAAQAVLEAPAALACTILEPTGLQHPDAPALEIIQGHACPPSCSFQL